MVKAPDAGKVRCPGCGRQQPIKTGDSIYWCGVCRCQYDASPEEGGSYFSDPSKRMEMQESRKRRK